MKAPGSRLRPRRSTRLLAGFATVSVLLAACGSDKKADTTSTTKPDATTASSASVTTAGSTSAKFDRSKYDLEATAKIAYTGPAQTLDPQKFAISTFPTWVYPIYDRLFQVDAKDTVQPMLAKSYDFSSDGKTLTLHLREDVVFHDGTSMDAAAVKASLERGKTVDGSAVSKVLSGITAIDVVDAHTVKLTLSQAGASLISVLSSNAGVVMNPKVIADASADLSMAPPAAVGTGPYVVTKSQPGAATSYARAPQYWNDSKGLLKGFTLTLVSDPQTRISGLVAGDFDIASSGGDRAEQNAADVAAGKYKFVEIPAASFDLALNMQSGDLADVNVRKAIALGIDHKAFSAIIKNVETTQPQRAGHWAHNDDIKNVYDPVAAKALIDARGGATFEITYGAGTSYEAVVQVMQSQLAKVGIKVTLRAAEQAQTQQLFTSGTAQSFMTAVQPQVDPAETLNRYFLGGVNLAKGTVATELHAIADPGNDPSLTQDQRAVIYKKAFKYIADSYLYNPVLEGVFGYAYTKKVDGLDRMPNAGLSTPDMSGLGILK